MNEETRRVYVRTDIPYKIWEVLLTPDEAGGYVAEVPNLPGCYSQGETVGETLANVRKAIELHLVYEVNRDGIMNDEKEPKRTSEEIIREIMEQLDRGEIDGVFVPNIDDLISSWPVDTSASGVKIPPLVIRVRDEDAEGDG